MGEEGAEGQEVDPEQVAMRAEELRGQLELLGRETEVFTTLTADHERALATLKGLQGRAPGEEALLPVGGNTFVAAQLAENEEVIVGVGADYAMPRPIAAAIAALEAEVAGMKEQLASLGATSARVEAEYTQLVQFLRAVRARQ